MSETSETSAALLGRRCTRCGAFYDGDSSEGPCACSRDGILEVEYDLDAARRSLTRAALQDRPRNMLRYREVLPLREATPVLAPIMTPVLSTKRLARSVGVADIQIKYEGAQASGSLKDRASAIAVARAVALGHSEIACASSGNAATSMAAMAAAQGLRSFAFVPRRVPAPKLAQLIAYGTNAVVVDGAYEDAYRLCGEAASTFGWYNRNCAQNPYLVEGKKTCGLEIAEQTSEAPVDWVVVPVGDGCTITGVWKGLREAAELGIGTRPPRLLAFQAEGAAPLYRGWKTNSPEPVFEEGAEARTLADSIAVARPNNGRRALAAIRDSEGSFVTVSDEELTAAVRELAAVTGVFAEPTSAGTLAAVRRARDEGIVSAGDRVALVATATGLKDVAPLAIAVPRSPAIAPTLDALTERLRAMSTSSEQE